MSTAYDRVIAALQSRGNRVIERRPGDAMAQCPAHDDRNPSLHVTEIPGSALLFCHAGCEQADVLFSLGLTLTDLYDVPSGARYDYTDAHGAVVRSVHRSPTKRFWQTGDKKSIPVLFHLPRLIDAASKGATIFLVEGEKDVLALETLGLAATTAPMGAANFNMVDATPLHGANVVAVVDDDESGRAWQEAVRQALDGQAKSLRFVRAATGKDAADHVAAGHGVEEFVAIEDSAAVVKPYTLEEAHAVFARWLGIDYDLDALDAMLAAAAVEQLAGDPVWLLIISGSGNAKTETVQALDGIGAIVTSTITSPGALLSGTSAHERTRDATGGLLRKIGDRGVLVIKDVTSILSMNRDMRAETLGALREVYDGRWSRNLGTDGGKTLEWAGRIAFIGAVTTAWDRAHDVIASMGDRFVLLRIDSGTGRQAAGWQAIRNTGHEQAMRAELSAAVGGVLGGMTRAPEDITPDETRLLLAAADLVTLARTGVEYDYRGDVIDAHAPEMPTRFAKQLAQILRGGLAIGMCRSDALKLAMRCARDSMPPLRLAIIDDVAKHPWSTTLEVRRRINKPRSTVDRQLQALHMLGVLHCDEVEVTYGDSPRSVWHYSVATGIEADALKEQACTRFVGTHPQPLEGGVIAPVDQVHLPTDISGTGDESDPSWNPELHAIVADMGRCPICKRVVCACDRTLSPTHSARAEETHP